MPPKRAASKAKKTPTSNKKQKSTEPEPEASPQAEAERLEPIDEEDTVTVRKAMEDDAEEDSGEEAEAKAPAKSKRGAAKKKITQSQKPLTNRKENVEHLRNRNPLLPSTNKPNLQMRNKRMSRKPTVRLRAMKRIQMSRHHRNVELQKAKLPNPKLPPNLKVNVDDQRKKKRLHQKMMMLPTNRTEIRPKTRHKRKLNVLNRSKTKIRTTFARRMRTKKIVAKKRRLRHQRSPNVELQNKTTQSQKLPPNLKVNVDDQKKEKAASPEDDDAADEQNGNSANDDADQNGETSEPKKKATKRKPKSGISISR
ncbi:hypothetical protein M3Y94_00716800 [Aphelenchoides besseyi]|nr:hypothetical protein M3Y94_00716800 [Aphelenchoides besseyi]